MITQLEAVGTRIGSNRSHRKTALFLLMDGDRDSPEVAPREVVHDVKMKRLLPFHREVDHALHVVVLTRGVREFSQV